MLKEITPSFKIFTDATMTGTDSNTSVASNLSYKDSVSISLSWTGTPTGSFQVQGSVDYNPGYPQSAGAPNAGTWVTVPMADVLGNAPAASGADGNAALVIKQWEFPWIRVVYTNASGTGVLNGNIMAKSLG